MAEQIKAHHTAVNMLVLRNAELQAAARDCVKLVDAARTEMYTPADAMLLEEIRALVK